MSSITKPVVYLISCAASSATLVPSLVQEAQAKGWKVCVITTPLGLLCEYTGLKMPIIAVPCFRTGGGLDGHPAFFRSIDLLRSYGVHVIYEPEKYPPKNQVPSEIILEELHKIAIHPHEKR